MRATLDRMWLALCAGRAPHEVGERIVVAFYAATVLWLCACAFLMLEPCA